MQFHVFPTSSSIKSWKFLVKSGEIWKVEKTENPVWEKRREFDCKDPLNSLTESGFPCVFFSVDYNTGHLIYTVNNLLYNLKQERFRRVQKRLIRKVKLLKPLGIYICNFSLLEICRFVLPMCNEGWGLAI